MNAPKTLPVVLPECRKPFGRFWRLGVFYKRGIVNGWKNWWEARQILRTYKAKNSRELTTAIVELSHLQNIEKQNGKTPTILDGANGLTRRQLLTVLRAQKDIKKLPLFTIIFIVLYQGVWLISRLFPNITPQTCVSEKKMQQLRQLYEKHATILTKVAERTDFADSVYRFNRQKLVAVLQTTDPEFSWRVFLMPTGQLRSKLLEHLMEVRADDELIRRGELAEMNSVELDRACMRRAILKNTESEKRAALKYWTENFTEPADIGMFITQKRNDYPLLRSTKSEKEQHFLPTVKEQITETSAVEIKSKDEANKSISAATSVFSTIVQKKTSFITSSGESDKMPTDLNTTKSAPEAQPKHGLLDSDASTSKSSSLANAKDAAGATTIGKKPRGRPKGSKNKKKIK